MAGGEGPGPSVPIRSGANKGWSFSILRKKRLAASRSRFAVRRKSTGVPCLSIARYRSRHWPRILMKILWGTGYRLGRLRATISGSATMTQHSHLTTSNGLDYDRTLILAVEVSGRSWVVAAQVPGLQHKGVKQQLVPRADALMAAIEGYKRRATAAGMAVERVIVAYESGGSGFWLARWLQQRGVKAHVMQPSSVPVDRRIAGPSPTASTPTCCCPPSWPGCGASRGCAPWCQYRTRPPRMPAAPSASARN